MAGRFIPWLLALFLTSSAFAQTPSTTPQREIEALFQHLAASQCRFQRNGDWHDARDATTHLRRKYDYLRKRDLAPTAEAFVERAASRSSLIGKAYRVQCGRVPAQDSQAWFLAALEEIRAAQRKR
jgi:hypothetical protein